MKRSSIPGTIYLLHFSRPYHHARHYLGWTEGVLEERLDRHLIGAGANLVDVVTASGISIKVVRTWSGTRHLERTLKRQNNGPRLCPICNKLGKIVLDTHARS